MSYFPPTGSQQHGRDYVTTGSGPVNDSHFVEYNSNGGSPPAPINDSPAIQDNENRNYSSQNNPITYTPTIGSRTSVFDRNVLTPQSYSPPFQSTGVPQLPRLTQFPSNATGLRPNRQMPFNELEHVNPAPVEAATHRQFLAPITGVSPNYQGNPNLPANQPPNSPNRRNTAVWITGLPPNLDYKMLLNSIRNCGKVYLAIVRGPTGRYITSASRLVFFDIAGARNLLKQRNEGSFLVGGYLPSVSYHWNKTKPRSLGLASRVLHINGPSPIVNQLYLANLFRSNRIIWQEEVVIELSSTTGITRLEWRFASYRGQAEYARYLIEEMKRRENLSPLEYEMWQRVTVHFGIDPCAPQPAGQETAALQGVLGPAPQSVNQLATGHPLPPEWEQLVAE